jgi:capsular polysaccharide biosynthesis protein
VNYDPACDLACEEIVGTTLGNRPPAHARSTMKWLRELALGAGVDRHERVYLSRAGYRRHPTNAAELETELGLRGFHQVRSDDGMIANRACLAARVIVGVEGTNLASAGFAPPGAIVIILLPQAGALPVYPFIFEACGHTTGVVSMQAGSTKDAPAFALDALRAALDWAGV